MLGQQSTKKALQRGVPEYEESRQRYFNRDDTSRYPAEIQTVYSSNDVVTALQRARDLNVSVGVRSGGHLPSKPSLVDGGVLIDTAHLNREVKYDPISHEVTFGPAVRVYEAWKATDAVDRFFPFGHAPDVALGGFCLAGGQGLFMRGWGATITEWIVRLEIVVPDGRTLMASREENPDLFWAARGGGQAFFGVVTKIWSRSIPKKQLFWRSFTFHIGELFEDLLTFAFERNKTSPNKFIETAVCVMHPELFDNSADEVPSDSSHLILVVNALAYADDLNEATDMLRSWDSVPDGVRSSLFEAKTTSPVSWEEFFELQRQINPEAPDQKWGIHSILSDPSVSLEKLLAAIKPAMCELPTKSSFGCIYMSDTLNPDESDAVFSLPQQYYILTFTGWKDPSLVHSIQVTMGRTYCKASTVACGMYIAGYDQSSESRYSPEVQAGTFPASPSPHANSEPRLEHGRTLRETVL